jgi:hypothetical protein
MIYIISPHPILSLRRGLQIGERADTCVDTYAQGRKADTCIVPSALMAKPCAC